MGRLEDSLKRLGQAIEANKRKKEERAAKYGTKLARPEAEIKPRSTEEILLSVAESDGDYEMKKTQIIEIALNSPQGEKACRDIYEKGLDCNLKDLQMDMGTMNWRKEF